MAVVKNKSEETSESNSTDERDGLSTYYYPDLGVTVRAKDRESADAIAEKKVKEQEADKATGEGKA